jgi:tetratricopeptide (TPR) repeat protein
MPPVKYIGRAPERATLTRLLGEAADGSPRLALIAGDPGIGKTRLATLAAIEAHGVGATVLYGRCDEDIRAPYQAWMEALGDFVDAAPVGLLRDHVEAHGGELTRLAPRLGRRVENVPPPQGSDPETERYLLFGAVTGLLTECSREQPVVLILDDLHWADTQTLTLLRLVASATSSLGVLVIGTYRPADIAAGHPLAGALAGLRREGGVEHINLSGLDDGEVLSMLEAAAGERLVGEGVELALAISQETEGNPFFVAEMMRHLVESGGIAAEDGHWEVSGDVAMLGRPDSVREVIGRRVGNLKPETRSALAMGAVIGRNFDFDLLLRVVACGEDQLLDRLEEATSAAVLTESATPGHYTFSHALINRTLYEDLSATRRARLHGRVAQELEQVCGDDPGPRLTELAWHYGAATAPLNAAKAIDYAVRAGTQALAQLAPEEALRWFDQAGALLDGRPQDMALRCELLIGLGDARRQVGDARFRDTLLEASALALQLGDDDRLVRAVLTNNRGRTSGTGRADLDRIHFVEAALERTAGEETPDRARLLSLHALELVFDPDSDSRRRRRLSDEALVLARQCGDDRALAQVLRDRTYILWAPGSVLDREAGVAELLEVAGRLDDPVVRFWALYNDVDVRMEQADVAGATRQARACTAIADGLRQPTLQWAAQVHETCIALATEDLPAVEARARRALDLGMASGEPDALITFAAQWGLVLIEQARWDECIPPGEKAARGFPGLPAFHASLGIQYLDAGRPDDARRVIDEAHQRGLNALGATPITSTALALYAETAARLEDSQTAAEIEARFAAVTEAVIWNAGVNAFNVTAYYRGLLAAVQGRHEEAEAGFREAIDLNLEMGAPRWCTRPRLAWAEMLLKSDAPGDWLRARQLFTEALAGARQAGCPALAQRALAGLGVVSSGGSAEVERREPAC